MVAGVFEGKNTITPSPPEGSCLRFLGWYETLALYLLAPWNWWPGLGQTGVCSLGFSLLGCPDSVCIHSHG